MKIIGKDVKRIDSEIKVTGQAEYGDDLKIAGLLHVKALRSPYAHAKILSVDASAAEAYPGVRAVVTGRDFPNWRGGEAIKDLPIVAVDRARFHGDPVAAVAADTIRIAEEAVKLIKVEYEELPVLLDCVAAAQPDAPLIHPNLKNYKYMYPIKVVEDSNICNINEYHKGDIEQGFAESELIFEDEYNIPTVQHITLETHCATARVNINGKIEVWTPCDAPHRLRKDLSDSFGIPLTRIRVHSTLIGGCFGAKGGLKMEPLVIALAMKTRGRPVSWNLDRHETITTVICRHAAHIRMKSGVKKDGTLVARDVELTWDTGAYAEKGPTVMLQGETAAPGPYNIPHVHLLSKCVYTNKVPAGAYRGYGTPKVAWAHETHMDQLAEKLGMDPFQFRHMNLLREGDIMPTGNNVPATSVGVVECLEEAVKAAKPPEKKNDGKLRGRGISTILKNTKTPSGSAAYVTINQDGSANILTSTVEVGQGAHTILCQIVCEEVGVPMRMIEVSEADTDTTPYDTSTTSSRSTFHMGNAVKIASQDVAGQLKHLAAKAFEVTEADIELDEGRARVRGQADKSMTFREVIATYAGAGGALLGKGFYYPDLAGGMYSQGSIFWMYGANIVDVAVDPETGKVEVEQMVCAHDVGRAINTLNCREQMIGGAVMGLGTALYEEMKYDAKGVVLNPSLHDYRVPTAMDVGVMTPIIVEAPHPEGPYGAKGIGEATVTPSAPAIGNAIANATGLRLKDLPMDCETIYWALQAKSNQSGK